VVLTQPRERSSDEARNESSLTTVGMAIGVATFVVVANTRLLVRDAARRTPGRA
jgi:hypothetical protein